MWTDLTFAARSLRKSPGFAFAAIVSLALGIGVCTTIFSAIDAVILRALPFPGVDRLVAFVESTHSCDRCSVSRGEYAALHAQRGGALASVAAFRRWQWTVAGRDGAEVIDGYRVTPSFFSVLGVPAELGRTFAPDSATPDLAHLAVVSDRFWRSRFGTSPRVVGSRITVSGEPYTVIGVMPPSFVLQSPADLWLPRIITAEGANDYQSHGWAIIARLADGVTLNRARSKAEAVSRSIRAADPSVDQSTRLVPMALSDEMLGDLRTRFLPLLAAAAFVLLIVCANVANLMLVRASNRERELAVRAALGGGQWRLFRQLFNESALAAGLGAVLGAVLAWLAIPVLEHSVPGSLQSAAPGWDTLALNASALAFTVGLAALSAFLFGTLPALCASRVQLVASLKDGGRGASSAHGGRTRQALVITELALAVVLLVGAGLMVRSFANLLGTNTGLHAEHTLTMTVKAPIRDYGGATKTLALVERIRAVLGAIPGVVGVAGTFNLPLSGTHNFTLYNVSGRPPLPLDRARVLRMVLRQAAALVAAGIVVGALGALGATRALSSLLYGVGAHDPGILIGVAGLLVLVALLASWVPAWRAAKVDPMVAMRAE